MVVLVIICDTIVVAGTCADAYFVGISYMIIGVILDPQLTFGQNSILSQGEPLFLYHNVII
jgi:hypothetical protein